MSLDDQYQEYVKKCKKNREYPVAFDIWKLKQRNKNALEIGFDLDGRFAGKPSGVSWSTSEGEFLS